MLTSNFISFALGQRRNSPSLPASRFIDIVVMSRPNSPLCRICFEAHGSMDDDGKCLGQLFAPCSCTGTQRWVHVGCLERWCASGTGLNPMNAARCSTCKHEYRMELKTPGWLEVSMIVGAACILVTALNVCVGAWLPYWFSEECWAQRQSSPPSSRWRMVATPTLPDFVETFGGLQGMSLSEGVRGLGYEVIF